MTLHRRHFLRGLGLGGAAVAVGLPTLDAMMNLEGTALADGESLPKRFVLWFWGNGTIPDEWAPAATGPGWETTPLLRGLEPWREQVSMLSGTSLPVRGQNNPHVEGACGILAGTNPLLDPGFTGSGGDWNFLTTPGPSLDVVAAGLLGETAFPSMVVGLTPPHGSSGPGTTVSYVSHNGAYDPNPPTLDPAAVFARFFGGGVPTPTPEPPTAEELARASVLDAVLEDARGLDRRLGAADRVRLDQHLSAIRSLERRLRATNPGMVGAACAEREGVPELPSIRDRARLMSELVALAFACDLTRVAVVEFSSPASHAGYPDVFPMGIQHNGAGTSFHEYEHNNGFDSLVRTGLTYFVDVFADHVGVLASTPDGAGSLLDQSLVLGTSELADGGTHGFDDFPLIFAGSAGGTMRTGHHVRIPGGLSSRGPLTVLRALGSTEATWGSDQFATSDAVEELLL